MDKNRMNASYDKLQILLKVGRYRSEITYTPYMTEVTTYEKPEWKTIHVVPTYGLSDGVTCNLFFNRRMRIGKNWSMSDII